MKTTSARCTAAHADPGETQSQAAPLAAYKAVTHRTRTPMRMCRAVRVMRIRTNDNLRAINRPDRASRVSGNSPQNVRHRQAFQGEPTRVYSEKRIRLQDCVEC